MRIAKVSVFVNLEIFCLNVIEIETKNMGSFL